MSTVSVNYEKNTLPTLPTELFWGICDLLPWDPWDGPEELLDINAFPPSIERVRWLLFAFEGLRRTSKKLNERCEEIIRMELDKIPPDEIPTKLRVIRYDMSDKGLGLLEAISQSKLFAEFIESIEYEAVDLKKGTFEENRFRKGLSSPGFRDQYQYCVNFYDQHQENISVRKDQRILKGAMNSLINLKHVKFVRIHMRHKSFRSIRRDSSWEDAEIYIKPKLDTKALSYAWYWTGIFNVARALMQSNVSIPSISFKGLVPDLSLAPKSGRNALGWMLRRCQKLQIQCRADYGGKPHSRNGFQAFMGLREREVWGDFFSCVKNISDLELSTDNGRDGIDQRPQPCKLLDTMLREARINQLQSFSIKRAEFFTTDMADFLTYHRYELRKIAIRGFPVALTATPAESWFQVFAAGSRLSELEDAQIYVDHDHVAGGLHKVFPELLQVITGDQRSMYNFGIYVMDQKEKLREFDDDLLLGFMGLGREQQRLCG